MASRPISNTKAGAPAVTDDLSKGYDVASLIVNTSVTPRTTYVCTNAAVGVAVWLLLGSGLLAFANPVQCEHAAVESFASTPASAVASNGTIGGP